MCPQVVFLDECNIAQLHFDINKEIPLKQSSRSNFCHSFMKVLLFLYVCPQIVLLGKSNNALFAFRFIFGLIGGDTFEVVKEEQYADHSSVEVMLFLYVCPKVVLLNESNFALVAFRLHLVAEVLLFLYVYPHEVSLDLSNDAPFAFLIIFCHTGGDTFEAVESRRSNSDHSEARL